MARPACTHNHLRYICDAETKYKCILGVWVMRESTVLFSGANRPKPLQLQRPVSQSRSPVPHTIVPSQVARMIRQVMEVEIYTASCSNLACDTTVRDTARTNLQQKTR